MTMSGNGIINKVRILNQASDLCNIVLNQTAAPHTYMTKGLRLSAKDFLSCKMSPLALSCVFSLCVTVHLQTRFCIFWISTGTASGGHSAKSISHAPGDHGGVQQQVQRTLQFQVLAHFCSLASYMLASCTRITKRAPLQGHDALLSQSVMSMTGNDSLSSLPVEKPRFHCFESVRIAFMNRCARLDNINSTISLPFAAHSRSVFLSKLARADLI